jgi:hypothetical protein
MRKIRVFDAHVLEYAALKIQDFSLSGQKNAYFANSPNTSHRPRFALASLRKATPRPAFDGDS